MSHIPDPAQPERVAIRPDGGLAFGVRFGPARTDGGPPTAEDIAAMTHLGWVDAEQAIVAPQDNAEEAS